MITLYQGPRAGVVPNYSPFCTKLELFLRAHKLQYQLGAFSPFKAPKGKMPYISYKGGFLGDSQIIIETLCRDHGLDPDAGLTPQQKAVSHAVRRMLEEGTYFCGFYNRWAVDENWAVVRERLFAGMPPPLKWILPGKLRKVALKALKAQGTGRHSYEEIMGFAQRDMAAVATLLGANRYFHGDRLTSVDLSIYAFASAFFKVPVPKAPKLQDSVVQPLTAYCDRIQQEFFPDLGR